MYQLYVWTNISQEPHDSIIMYTLHDHCMNWNSRPHGPEKGNFVKIPCSLFLMAWTRHQLLSHAYGSWGTHSACIRNLWLSPHNGNRGSKMLVHIHKEHLCTVPTHNNRLSSNLNHQEHQYLMQLSHIILYSFTSCLFILSIYKHQHIIKMAKRGGDKMGWQCYTVTHHQVTLKTSHNDAPLEHHTAVQTLFKSLQVCTLYNDSKQSPQCKIKAAKSSCLFTNTY